jgi:FtsZ-binding cell division protein ZapB
MENFDFNNNYNAQYKNGGPTATPGKDYYRVDDLRDNNVEDLKEKLNIMTNKFATIKKEKEQLQKENKELQNDILVLQSNIRQMIPGFSSNTSSSFPMLNELQNKISEFFKCDCQDIFFDLLSPELNMDGIVFFYRNSLSKVQDLILNYFEPLDSLLRRTLCIDQLWSPIDNVLRKSFQSNWKKIYNQLQMDGAAINTIMTYIQGNLKLQDEEPNANRIIVDFLKKATEILFFCHISDPPIFIDHTVLGQKVLFNSIKYDSIDGFIKQKHECIVMLPPIYKNSNNSENLLLKAQVLPLDYEFP